MKLSDIEIVSRLRDFPGWEERDGMLTRVFRFSAYMDGVDFVNRAAAVAEEKQHHPDLLLTYGQVEVRITTHDEGGITEKDFDWIRRLERA